MVLDSIKHRFAFTLAEVLITLGIIGVVAAMTLPTLIHNYQKKSWVEGLKVGMSVIEQGIKKAMADDGVTNFKDTELFSTCSIGSESWNTFWANKPECETMLNKYYKIIKLEKRADLVANGDTGTTIDNTAKCQQLVGKVNKWWRLDNKSKCLGYINNALTLYNGIRMDMWFKDNGFHFGDITLDVNGSKGPNMWGRDVFFLRILNSGNVVPTWGEQYIKVRSEYKNEDYETALKTYNWRFKNDLCSTTSSNSENEIHCAARIMESGWKMDY